jgi:hypothetical protein
MVTLSCRASSGASLSLILILRVFLMMQIIMDQQVDLTDSQPSTAFRLAQYAIDSSPKQFLPKLSMSLRWSTTLMVLLVLVLVLRVV